MLKSNQRRHVTLIAISLHLITYNPECISFIRWLADENWWRRWWFVLTFWNLGTDFCTSTEFSLTAVTCGSLCSRETWVHAALCINWQKSVDVDVVYFVYSFPWSCSLNINCNMTFLTQNWKKKRKRFALKFEKTMKQFMPAFHTCSFGLPLFSSVSIARITSCPQNF